MFKTVLALAILLVVEVLATPLHGSPSSTASLHEDQRVIAQEVGCAEQGGMCRELAECNPSDIVRVADLCPLQSHRGVICCYYE